MKAALSKYKLELAGMMIGAIAGWCYWKFVGCASGNCPITSNPLNSSLYGGLMGFLGFSIFRRSPKKVNSQN